MALSAMLLKNNSTALKSPIRAPSMSFPLLRPGGIFPSHTSNGANPDLLISGSNFLKGDHYILLDTNNPSPPAFEKKQKPRIRYFSEPEPIEEDYKKSSAETIAAIPAEPGPKGLLTAADIQKIVCINCAQTGHITCSSAAQKIPIKWKPAIEFENMKKRLTTAKNEEKNIADDMEMNIAYHLKGIGGNNKVKANSTLGIENKYKKYKKRMSKSKRLFCCRCGEHHKLSQCSVKPRTIRWSKKGKHTNLESSQDLDAAATTTKGFIIHNDSDSDGSTASGNGNEGSIEEFLINALAKGKKLPPKYYKTMNRGLLKRCAKIANLRKVKKTIKKFRK